MVTVVKAHTQLKAPPLAGSNWWQQFPSSVRASTMLLARFQQTASIEQEMMRAYYAGCRAQIQATIIVMAAIQLAPIYPD